MCHSPFVICEIKILKELKETRERASFMLKYDTFSVEDVQF